MHKQPDLYYDEIDIRELVRTLLGDWKIILAIMILMGVAAFGFTMLQSPVYEAKAHVSVDAVALELSIDPINILLSDDIRQQVADTLAMQVEELPNPLEDENEEPPLIMVEKHSIGNTTYIITIQSEDPYYSRDVVNAWANLGTMAALDFLSPYFEEETVTKQELDETDQNLIQYLEENHLERWTWTELVLLTGFGQQPTVLLTDNIELDSTAYDNEILSDGSSDRVLPNIQELPLISSQQRLDILQLMREKGGAESAYYNTLHNSQKLKYALETTPPSVLNHALLPEKPVNKKILRNTALGLILGLFLGAAWKLVILWWQAKGGE